MYIRYLYRIPKLLAYVLQSYATPTQNVQLLRDVSSRLTEKLSSAVGETDVSRHNGGSIIKVPSQHNMCCDSPRGLRWAPMMGYKLASLTDV